MRKSLLNLAAPLLLAFLIVGVYSDPLFTRRNFGGRDLSASGLTMEKAVHDAYARGRLPVWLSEISGGRPLLANPNAGALYPVRPLLALLPFPLAIKIYPILHWIAAAIGMMLLARAFDCSAAAGWIGAVTYVFSGISVSQVFYTQLHPGTTLLPWLLWALVRPGWSESARLLVLAVLFGLDLLAADVFTIGIGILCLILWIGIGVAPSRRLRELTLVGAAFFLGCLLAAPQIIATSLWIPQTNRAVLGMKLEEALLYSASPFRLLELLIPFPFGPVWRIGYQDVWGISLFHGKAAGFYVSFYAGAFAVIAFILTLRVRATAARFARSAVLFSLLISVLPSLLPDRWRQWPSPLPLRNPEKLAVGLTFGLAILASLGFDHVRQARSIPRWILGVGVLLTYASLLAYLFPSSSGGLAAGLAGASRSLSRVAAQNLPGDLAEGGLFWVFTLLALWGLAHPASRTRWMGLLLLTVIPILANRRIAATFRQEEVFAPTAFERSISRADPMGLYRVLGESFYRPPSRIEREVSTSDTGYIDFTRRVWYIYTHALWQRGTVFNQDLDAGDLARVEALRKASFIESKSQSASRLFGSVGLRWGIRYRDHEPLPGYRRFGGDLQQDWDEHERPFPSIRLLERWREERGALFAWKALPSLQAGEIVIESGVEKKGEAGSGRLQVLEDTPERMILRLEARDSGWLFVLRAFWDWRSIRLDGREIESYPAQLAYTAVPIPPGRHRLEWQERLPGGPAAMWGPVLFLAAVPYLLWRDRRFGTSR